MTLLDLDVASGLARITLKDLGGRVPVLSADLLGELDAALEALAAEPGVERLLLVSASPRAFAVSPSDDEIPVGDPERLLAWSRHGQRVLARLASLPFVSVACLEAPAIGAGFELALACSARVLAHPSRAGMGFLPAEGWRIPAWGGSVRLARRLGPTLAWEVLRSAALIPPPLARRWVLADALAAPGEACAVASRVAPQRPRWPLLDRWLWALPGGAGLLIRRLEARAGPASGAQRVLLDQVRRALSWPVEEALAEEGRALVALARATGEPSG